MKLQFEPDLDYQQDAISAVCDLFRGQEICRTEFTVSHNMKGQLSGFQEGDLGVGNLLQLSNKALLANLREVQLRNGLLPAESLKSRDFTVEMETGTGKTYVYLRTIFELKKRYGFTKFVIVVPSVAIKEGVNKSLDIMGEHLRALYSRVPFEYFVYDSQKLGQVRNFATSQQVQIMVMTVGAINKRAVNNIYQPNEKTGGEKPIDLVRAANPVLIVDEPQSVDGGLQGKGREALDKMRPLCTLRYSATHAEEHHMVYRLNAVDAYKRRLVKQIEVAAGVVTDDHNRPYIRLVDTHRKQGSIRAKVEVDAETRGGGVRRRILNVSNDDDLGNKTGREVYRDYRIGEISVQRDNKYLELQMPGGEYRMKPGEAHGDVDSIVVHREMIRKTIREHFDKRKRLKQKKIKVLTLFFIDKVAHYRCYDDDGKPVKGEYARVFEEEYRLAANLGEYRKLFDSVDIKKESENVHEGYFSIDRKGGWIDTSESNQVGRDNAERAYRLIMRDKEKLLSLKEPLQFIFSHSALREGWDNPNVFQICALRDISTERERRQTIGRGLRLCVDQNGKRQSGFGENEFEVNTLTVIARESYEEFADNLQREIEKETGIRFGFVEKNAFASIGVKGEDGQVEALGVEKSLELWEHLVSQGYLDSEGRILDEFQNALDSKDVSLPNEFKSLSQSIVQELERCLIGIDIKKADERCLVKPHKAMLDSDEFQALWERIKHKTTFRVDFRNNAMIESCSKVLSAALRRSPMPRPKLAWKQGHMSLGHGGVKIEVSKSSTVLLDDVNMDLPDLLTNMQDMTGLTRRSICDILIKSGRLDDFKTNPAKFIKIAAETINLKKSMVLVNGIKYQRRGSEHFFAQELFRKEELIGYLKNMIKVEKSVYDHVVYQSKNEAKFAEEMEKLTIVKVYAKLPHWFQIRTPLGPYNPDWAVLVEDDKGERLYLVAETKGSTSPYDLREIEQRKVQCGEKHFEALKTSVHYGVFKNAVGIDDLLKKSVST